MTTSIIAINLTVLVSVLNAIGALFLKKGAAKFNFSLIQMISNYYIIAGGIFYILSTMLFLIALKSGELSVLYPLAALSYIWVSLLSITILNEKISNIHALGIVLVVAGVITITLAGI